MEGQAAGSELIKGEGRDHPAGVTLWIVSSVASK